MCFADTSKHYYHWIRGGSQKANSKKCHRWHYLYNLQACWSWL
ncbi:pyrophosphate--fructose 6-phosphate 1-phosphotransferase subunit beta 1 [Iris pallida]|nr:pyrophosphate--fructose 6-phosphate 1-phosphotransferase subunit beta 1 [Iris pallida]